MNDLSNIDDSPSVSHPPIGSEVASSFLHPSCDKVRPIRYNETPLKNLADDINQQINTQFRPQIESLEDIAKDSKMRVKMAEKQLKIHEENLALYKKQLADAERETKAAAKRSWIAIGISIAAIVASIAGCILGAAITAGWI